MSLSKKALCRVYVLDPKTRKTLFFGTVYANGLNDAKEVVEKIKEALK